jgi:small subunit ribosomal protein S8
MVNDIISDMLTKIRNANSAKHELVEISYTKITESITKILKEEGLINDFKINNETNSIILLLKFKGQNRKPVIQKLERISKPGLRIYENKKKISKKVRNFMIFIVSTSKGIMTDQKAKFLNIGGEILCKIS